MNDIYTALTLAEERLLQLRALKDENAAKIADVQLEIEGLRRAIQRGELNDGDG